MNAISAKHIFLIAFILMNGFSCTKEHKDNSFTVDEYVKMGVPDPGKPWDPNDFSQAYGILANLKWNKPFQLPAKDSKKSGLLFEHMLSLKHVAFLKDSTVSLNEKAERISAFLTVYDYWMNVYSNPVIKNYYHRELIYIQIFNLRLSEAMANLAQEISKSDEPTAAVLHYGVQSIKKNYLNALTTDLKTQSNTSLFLTKDLDTMADSIYVSVMRNKTWMDSSAIKELKQTLLLVMDSASSDYIQKKYQTLEKSL